MTNMMQSANNKNLNFITVTLPDGSQREFPHASTVLDIATAIGPGLARNTLAGKIDGKLADACDTIEHNAAVQIITPKNEEGLEIIRHTCAHLIGHAIKQLYPLAKMVIGPVIDNGFYYDIAYERPFTANDLAAIEKRMAELIATNYDVIKRVLPREEVTAIFNKRAEHYKLNLVEDMPGEKHINMYFH